MSTQHHVIKAWDRRTGTAAFALWAFIIVMSSSGLLAFLGLVSLAMALGAFTLWQVWHWLHVPHRRLR